MFVDGFNVLDVIHYSKKNLLKELSVEIRETDNGLDNNFGEVSKTLLRSTTNKTDIEAIDLKLGDSNQIRIKCTFSSLNESHTVLVSIQTCFDCYSRYSNLIIIDTLIVIQIFMIKV